MKSIAAIASVSLKAAVRSRVVLALSGLVLLILILIPQTVEGDGTVWGQVNITLRYTLTATVFLLGVATVWSGCASVSSEIREKQIQLLMTKPVRALDLWLGKWLALLILNAVLLGFAGLAVFVLLQIRLNPDRFDTPDAAEAIAETHRVREGVHPLFPGLDEQIHRLAALSLEQGGSESKAHPDDVFQALRSQYLHQLNRVERGQERSWTFPGPRHPNDQVPVQLRYSFSSSATGPAAMSGTWSLLRSGEPIWKENVTQTDCQNASIFIPSELVSLGEPVTLRFHNHSDTELTVIFDPDHFQLRYYRHGFFLNLFKGMLLLFFQLALLSAIGLTAGSLFSLPVAALISGYTVILFQADDYIHRMASATSIFTGLGASMDPVMRVVFRVMSFFLRPLADRPVLEWLSEGDWIQPAWVLSDGLLRLGVYGLVLAVLGVWVFRRRELALPV